MSLPQESHPGSTPRLLTISGAAELLSCSRANVYGLIDAGDLPVITVGKSRGYRIDVRDIEEFLERRKVCKDRAQPKPPAPRPRLKHIKL